MAGRTVVGRTSSSVVASRHRGAVPNITPSRDPDKCQTLVGCAYSSCRLNGKLELVMRSGRHTAVGVARRLFIPRKSVLHHGGNTNRRRLDAWYDAFPRIVESVSKRTS
ncbi:unnamed protein product [Macrosiphum euphorbiae]|uniref:Uncharacterized protein n=1 Tax=Macrosiphum euphorbiae TaxID=13131 RepID=A0AAV0VGI5_9HEMI|nr:unnamed protein product [Macrosiphum euphorbiae]